MMIPEQDERPTPDEVEERWTDPEYQGTHYAGCWKRHPICSLVHMISRARQADALEDVLADVTEVTTAEVVRLRAKADALERDVSAIAAEMRFFADTGNTTPKELRGWADALLRALAATEDKPAAPSLVVGPGPLVCRAWDWITGADENDPAFSLVLELAEALADRERRLRGGGRPPPRSGRNREGAGMSELWRRKPVIVEAMQYTVDNCLAIHEWMGVPHDDSADCDTGICIPTREGDVMWADVGDWIIKEPLPGGDWRFYPCEPDIFQASYDILGDEAPR